MATFADLLVSAEDTQSAAWYIKFAQSLKMDLDKAKRLYSRYGNGNLYANGRFVGMNSPERRARMARRYGMCVVVEFDGKMWIKTEASVGRMNRQKHRIEAIQEGRARKREREDMRKQRACERMFEDGQGKVCRKHQGKGDSMGELGKYAYVPRRSMLDSVPKAQTRLVVVRIG